LELGVDTILPPMPVQVGQALLAAGHATISIGIVAVKNMRNKKGFTLIELLLEFSVLLL
jgi:hypothetical protein